MSKAKPSAATVDLSSYTLQVIVTLREAGKYPAVRTYRSTLNSFLAFAETENKPPTMRQVFTPGLLKEYEQWLFARSLSPNTVSTYIRTLRAIYNRWMPVGSRKHNPKMFADLYTRVVSKTKRALTVEQTGTLLRTDPAQLPAKLQPAMAYFLMTFLLRGMPFIDLAHLRKSDVKEGTIVYCRHKTGRQLTVRIPDMALPLLERFRNTNPASVYLFPILTAGEKGETQYACYLKALRKFNKQLATIAALLLPGVKISSYTARHTWATLNFHRGVAVGIICEALGHSSSRVTDNYLKAFENSRIDQVNDDLINSILNYGTEKEMLQMRF